MRFFKTFLAALLAVLVGSLLTGFIWIMTIIGLAASFDKGSVYIEPHSILKIDLAEDINDTPMSNPFSQIDYMTMDVHESVSLYNILCAIDAAKNDDRIDGIYIRPCGAGSVDATSLEEIRASLEEFRAETGKFILAYNETYSQTGYWLASVADRVYIQPEGGMMWQGLGFNLTFFKGLLDKLGITVEVFRPTACKYKSAVEPYILTRMSDANRLQMQELAESMWSTIAGDVSKSRGISVEKLNELADNLSVTLPEEALAHGFVDGTIYEDQMNDIFAEFGAVAGSDGEYRFVTLGEYASQTAGMSPYKSDKVAIIYAEGQIVDGYGAVDAVYGNSLAERLAEARRDKTVKAVVLRVNSPGGSALASDIIWREMELLKAEKPVIVSMGAYAASGGYYISAPADVIMADRLTLTGSIGVFGLIPQAGKFLENKLGVTFDGVGTNKYSDMGNLTRAMSATEKAAIMRGVDKVYDTFTGLVSEGRNLPLEKVLDIAGGRVWSGSEALGIGLADGCGGLKASIAVAADKAGLGDNFGIIEMLDVPEGLMGLLTSLNAQVRERRLRTQLGEFYNAYTYTREAVTASGIQAYCPYRINFE